MSTPKKTAVDCIPCELSKSIPLELGVPSCPLWLFLFLLCRQWRFRLRSGHAGQHVVKGFFGGHLFFAAFVLPEFVFAVAGAAARSQHFFAHHRNNRMVGGALAARTMIVDIVAQSHG